jgi:hypothetical protein
MHRVRYGAPEPLAPWGRAAAHRHGFQVAPAQPGHPTNLHGSKPALSNPLAESRRADPEPPGGVLDWQEVIHADLLGASHDGRG